MGRLPVLATLEDLDEEALVTILTKPKNALVKQYQRLFELEDTELTFTDDALTAIAKRAIERKTGARGLRSILEDILLDTMFELPSLDSVTKVVVNEEAVSSDAGPLMIHADEKILCHEVSLPFSRLVDRMIPVVAGEPVTSNAPKILPN